MAKVDEADQLLPPVKGWVGVKWESDPTMECSRELSPACSEIIVELTGAALKKIPMCAGSYLPVEGKIVRGRPLLQHSSGSNRYLRVRTGGTQWGTGDTIDENKAWIISGSAGGVCPAQPSNDVNSRIGHGWQW